LIAAAGESGVRITIVEDVATGTNTARIIFLTTKEKRSKIDLREARSERPYLKEFNLPTPLLTPGGRSRHRSKSRRSIIIDDVIFIDIEPRRRWLLNLNLIL
jgi:hypothetical protein